MKLEELSVSCGKEIESKLILFEINRLKKRVLLAEALKAHGIWSVDDLLANKSVYSLFYKHLLYEWTSDSDFSLLEFTNYQRNEIKEIRSRLKALAEVDEKPVTEEKELTDYISKIDKRIASKLSVLFPENHIPPVVYKKNPFPNMSHVPGFYKNNIFYFTFNSGNTFKSDMDWLYLHEAIPGHHYQLFLDNKSVATNLFSRKNVYFDFTEGWAAYVETLGDQLGVYASVNSLAKALRWDLVRSVRVLVDIGIHRDGWTKAEALDFWRVNAPEVYSLAEREVDRITKWPAQVISYEYGKYKILKAKRFFIEKGRSEREFHKFVLNQGQVPSSLL